MAQKDESTLIPAQVNVIKNELNLNEPNHVNLSQTQQDELSEKANTYVKQLIHFEVSDLEKKEEVKASVEDYGQQLQQESASQSQMLRQPLKDLSRRGEDGSDVSQGLIDLKLTVEKLDPASFDLEPGFLSRTLGFLPFIGTPMKRYFSKFESAQTVINAIIGSLEKGKDQLGRDNITLVEDQNRMREIMSRLEKSIKIGQLMDQKLEYAIQRDLASDPEKKKFVENELLFPLRQRIMDLQQQMAVSQQGILAAEIIIRNNKELVRGVNRALNVTVSALEVAVTTAMALANQKIVLEKIHALNTTTNNLIASNAARLKEQGAEIQKQAASTSVDIEVLKVAFSDIKQALADISNFRQQALPEMAKSIIEMDNLIDETQVTLKQSEKASKVQSKIEFDF